jgi:hypothetical protein
MLGKHTVEIQKGSSIHQMALVLLPQIREALLRHVCLASGTGKACGQSEFRAESRRANLMLCYSGMLLALEMIW